MIARGSDPVTAGERANSMLFGMIQQQATMLSFLDVMKLFGVLFLLITPLVLFAKSTKKGSSNASEALH